MPQRPRQRQEKLPYVFQFVKSTSRVLADTLKNPGNASTAAATRTPRAVDYLKALHGERTAEATWIAP